MVFTAYPSSSSKRFGKITSKDSRQQPYWSCPPAQYSLPPAPPDVPPRGLQAQSTKTHSRKPAHLPSTKSISTVQAPINQQQPGTLATLCPEDRRRVATLVRQLALAQEAKEKLTEQVETGKRERKTLEEALSKAEGENKDLAERREAVERKLARAQELLRKYDEEIDNTRAEVLNLQSGDVVVEHTPQIVPHPPLDLTGLEQLQGEVARLAQLLADTEVLSKKNHGDDLADQNQPSVVQQSPSPRQTISIPDDAREPSPEKLDVQTQTTPEEHHDSSNPPASNAGGDPTVAFPGETRRLNSGNRPPVHNKENTTFPHHDSIDSGWAGVASETGDSLQWKTPEVSVLGTVLQRILASKKAGSSSGAPHTTVDTSNMTDVGISKASAEELGMSVEERVEQLLLRTRDVDDSGVESNVDAGTQTETETLGEGRLKKRTDRKKTRGTSSSGDHAWICEESEEDNNKRQSSPSSSWSESEGRSQRKRREGGLCSRCEKRSAGRKATQKKRDTVNPGLGRTSVSAATNTPSPDSFSPETVSHQPSSVSHCILCHWPQYPVCPVCLPSAACLECASAASCPICAIPRTSTVAETLESKKIPAPRPRPPDPVPLAHRSQDTDSFPKPRAQPPVPAAADPPSFPILSPTDPSYLFANDTSMVQSLADIVAEMENAKPHPRNDRLWGEPREEDDVELLEVISSLNGLG
ncbi:hypothetical protein HK104_004465 [Borealophlyctis nickersoniae]|nr:hypothetical protein HK104_004465 [Borealophlyctis nickersoniae]